MGTYDRIAATALRLITAKGSDAVISRIVPSTFDPVTQARTSSTLSATFKAVELPPGKSAEFRIGSLVDRNLSQFFIARAGVEMEPTNGDRIEWAGRSMTLTGVTHYDPAGDGAILTVAYGER